MKKLLLILVIAGMSLGMALTVRAEDKAANKYVGLKKCAMCHKSATSGNQFGIWEKSKHAEAFKVLLSDKAAEVAKKKGLTKPASESPECLECHTLAADAKLLDKAFDPKDGVQCEACHGAGSAYMNMAVMKDKAKSITAGLHEYKDDAAIEAKCKTCHNDKSPTFKGFVFKDMWGKIKHPVPPKK